MKKCDICERKFVKPKQLSNHRRWHNLPEYKQFQRNYLKFIRQHHPNSGKKFPILLYPNMGFRKNNPMKDPIKAKEIGKKIKQSYWFLTGGTFARVNQYPKLKTKIMERMKHENPRRFNKCPSRKQIELFSHIQKLFKTAKLEYPVRIGDRTFYLDIAIPEYKIDIEYDGKEWHKDIKKDLERDQKLNSLGWNVFRIKQGDVEI